MNKKQSYVIYLTVFTTGAAVLIIEILGTRVLAPFYGSTIFVWSSLITVTLAALAGGYWWGGRDADRHPYFGRFFTIIIVASAATALITKLHRPLLIWSEQFGLQYGPLAAAALLFGPALFLLGMVTPFAIRLRTHHLEAIGARSGGIFAFSTIGSLVGALLAGFVLIPLVSVSTLFLWAAGALLLVAVAGWLLTRREHHSAPIVILACAIALGALLSPRASGDVVKQFPVLTHRSSLYGDITVTGTREKPCLWVNGQSQTCLMTSAPDNPTSIIGKQIKVLTQHLAPGSRVLLLGLGGGTMTAAMPDHVTVDAVELDPAVVDIAREYFGVNKTTAHTVIDDARRFVRNVPPNTYDIVIQDIALGSYLPYYVFSKEHLTALRRSVRTDGLVVMHVGASQLTEASPGRFLLSVFKTAEAVFEHVDVYSSSADRLTNTVLYLYKEPSDLTNERTFYHRFTNINTRNAVVATDDFNPLEHYYTPHAFDLRGERAHATHQLRLTH